MNTFSKMLLVGVLGFVFTVNGSAKTTPTTWTGTLVDRMCYDHAIKKHDMSLLQGHEKECIMKCAVDGKTLGIMIDGKYYALDRKGEKLAYKVLKASKVTEDVQVTITGTLKADKITVKSVKPVQA